MADPIVTVIVPVYNGEKYLRESLESTCAQDFESYEVIVVDDGSTDRTGEIARSLPVRYLRQENQGQGAAKNAGMELARGRFIAFHDHDDVMPPTKLRVQSDYLLDHPETGCVLGRNDWIFEGGTAPPWMTRDPIYGDLGGIQPGTAMIRKEDLRKVGGFDVTYRWWHYQNLFVRLREHGVKIEVLLDVVLLRRLHGENMTLFPPPDHPLLRTMREKLQRERGQ